MFKRMVFLMLLGCCSLVAAAQNQLHIASLFGKVAQAQHDALEIYINDPQKLRDYHLTLFRSLSIIPGPSEVRQIAPLVMADVKSGKINEIGKKSGQLFYVFCTLPPEKGRNRYIFYRNNALYKDSDGKLTLVYMEGPATYSQLRKIFR